MAGVTHAGGTGIAAATEFLPWADAANLGDLFHASSIVFSSGLGALASSSWRDDTDRIGSVPVPSSLALLGLALAALPLARGRRARSVAPGPGVSCRVRPQSSGAACSPVPAGCRA